MFLYINSLPLNILLMFVHDDDFRVGKTLKQWHILDVKRHV